MTPAQTTIRFAPRVLEMQTSSTLAVMNRAKQMAASGVDVIDFGPGEPDFITPSSVIAAAKDALDAGYTKYTNTPGTNELRSAIAGSYNSRYGTSLAIANVIAGCGGKQELFNLMLALVSDGDEVIIPSPYWVSFPDQVSFAGGSPVIAPTDPANRFRPTLETIEPFVTDRSRGVILNSPCNPSGAVIAAAELERIIRFCHERQMFVIFDETYEFFVYDGAEHVSAMRWFDEFPETIISVNSMSKTWAMTGWRLGYAIAHPEIVGALSKIQSHSTSNPSSISQWAAVAALGGGSEEIHRMHRAYVERRKWLIPALNAIPGITCDPPDGAFYVFPSVRGLYGKEGIQDSTSLSEFLLNEAHVAVVPGKAFGADEFIRISYAVALDRLQEGVERIRRSLERLG